LNDAHVRRQIFELRAADEPLLTYGVLPVPNPLLASGGASLTLVVSNGGSQIVTVASITITLPVGTNAKNLTPSGNGITTQPSAGWNVAQNGGAFTLTPQTAEAAKVGARGLAFVFSSIAVNGEPGTCTLAIAESASSPAKPQQNRTTGIALAKFPAQFALGDLTVTPPSVAPGGSVSLMWTGSPATYVLSYDPDGNGTRTYPVGASGPYTAANLTAPIVVFTLTVTVTVPGQDQPLVTQRQAIVTVATGTLAFTALPNAVGVNGVAKLAWRATGATSCTLDPGDERIPLSGYAYVIVPKTTLFTVVAIEAGTGRRIAQQQTVTVDPAIVPTATFSFIAADGLDGENGGDSRNGGDGGDGTDAVAGVLELGPLDLRSRPAQVFRIVSGGGNGGKGGNGGDASQRPIPAGNGGDGGDGGDGAVITLRLGSSAVPQQIVIENLRGSRGGAKGLGGQGKIRGRDGEPGLDGELGSIAFEETAPAGEPGETEEAR
jgi:hypothetical protein